MLLLLLLLSFVIKNECNKIVGGIPVLEGEYPFMAALSQKINAAPYCGGTLISKSFVLSAAHCPDPSYVFVGCANYKKRRCDRIKVKKSYTHPLFSIDSFRYDFKLIQLEEESIYPPIESIAGLELAKSLEGSTVLTMGWGAIEETGPSSSILNKVEVDVVSKTACQKAYRYTGLSVYSDQICAARYSKDSCYGDSGGPLLLSCNGSDVLVGVVSWGIGCATAYPGVYGIVGASAPWINSIVPGISDVVASSCSLEIDNGNEKTSSPTEYPTSYPTNYPTVVSEKPWWCFSIFC